MKPVPLPLLLALLVPLAACGSAEGLRSTPEGDGPTVVVDWDAEPLPELPFPNDLATQPDPTSATGLRLNFSELASTELERDTRRKVNRLDGFGVFAPISVRFDRALDLDRIASLHADDGDVSDDAVYVIDVSPGSPGFLQAAELDVGHGRFPGDLVQTDAYFPNDPRSGVPSLMFETFDEDADGDGGLDPGEDTDGDGLLDHQPNVWPEGGDPRQDLLTWYERQTDTLIVRPAVPLREATTYAVVLTERLVGEDGAPVRSPWRYVNHTRQTDALLPVLDALPAFGLGVDDVAFAWTFTTGRITGDLVDLRRGLHGEGPYAHLEGQFPARVHGALPVQDEGPGENPYRVPTADVIAVLAAAGVVPEHSADALFEGYRYSEAIVSGIFTSPDLLYDRDDGGRDTSDEIWSLDAPTGRVDAVPREIAFTCTLPVPDDAHQPPFPVAIYGHGYGSSRLEFAGFAWALNRVGYAACAMDFPGHGLDIDPEERELAATILELAGLLPFLEHLEVDRARDLDNDGRPDSGDDQWTADGFHTRDTVRQAVVDWFQMVRALRACGEGTMGVDIDGDGAEEASCDWDGDGTPDIAGPDAPLSLMGGSLGGIDSAIAGAVEPEFEAVVPVVAGGGLMDIGWRSNLGGVVEALVGRLLGPLLLGLPGEDGTLRIVQYVTSATDMREVHVATLPTVPGGGRVRVENLDNGEVREAWIPSDGRFRLSIPSDAPDPPEKAILAGIPETGPEEGVAYEVPGNEGLGDRWRIAVFDSAGAEVALLDTFEADVVHEGITMRAGSPIVAGTKGLAHVRGTPRLRRVLHVLSLITEPGDPIAYARAYLREPFVELGEPPPNLLLLPSPGDTIVTVASEIALARAAGVYDRHAVDERYGMTVDRWLIENEVVRGLEEWGPFTGPSGEPVLFDADDLDGGSDGYGAPSDAPLRATVQTDRGVSGMRLPYVSPAGSHGFNTPDPSLPFDIHTFSVFQAARFIQTGGQEISDDPCLEDGSCAFFRTLQEDP
ncbi:hypothetical protein L6R50_17235 [Myxococcota bacterium]|nr:hypothetical protein [Myxococcota bacterium]